MSIRHISELGTDDVERLGLQPATGRINKQPRIYVQAQIADALRTSGAFRAAEQQGEEGHDLSARLPRVITSDVLSEAQEPDEFMGESAL